MSGESKPSSEIAADKPPRTESAKANPKPENPPNPPQIIPPAEQRPERDSETEKHRKDLTCWGIFERIAKVVEFFGIIGALIFICVQWNDINATSQDVGQAINLISNQVVFAQSQVKTMQEEADTMKGQLDEMRLDARAWVFAEIQTNILVVEQTDFMVQIKITNTGKTPAFITGEWDRQSGNINEISNTAPKVSGMNIMLIPNYSQIVTNRIQAIHIAENFPIYIWGTVYYDDIFGTNHWTQFCYSLTDGGKQITTMLFHNSCDNAQTNQTK